MLRKLLVLLGVGLCWIASGADAGPRPRIGQPQHQPAQPKSQQAVVVTVDIPFDHQSASATLQLQAIAPGVYIRRSDAEYEKKWIDLPMRNDGLEGDARANDNLLSARIAGEQLKHRWLYRYRVVVKIRNETTTMPTATDPSPNYAFFCYDGIPAWTGAREPGKTPPRTFSSDFLNTIEPYHLIARGEDIATSQWDGSAHKKRFPGTLVYGGVVYDHIEFHSRGQGSAHIAGKNKWGLKFNPKQPVSLKNNRGSYQAPWTSVDLNPGQHTPYIPVHRGIAGLDEAVTFRAFQLAGVPSSSTHWVHFRVIDGAEEASKTNQYDGDLWGLYLAIADIDQDLLNEQKLPDGLLVSIQSGVKHVPKDGSAGQKEWDQFLGGLRSNPPEDWWRKNLHLQNYFSFHALNRLIGNVDIRPDGNHGYYRAPDGRWSPIPWDNDMCFVPRHHQPGHIDAVHCLNHPRIKQEYQNRAREILDLFAADAAPTGGQVGQLVAEMASVLSPPKFETNWAQLDEAMWNMHPRFNQKGSYFVNPAYGDHFGGRWERKLATNDIRGFEKYLIEFCTDSRPQKTYAPNDGNPLGYGWGYVAHEARDEKIPPRPALARDSSGKWRYKVIERAEKQDLKIEWRVGRIGPGRIELEEYFRLLPEANTLQTTLAAEVFKEPGTYRVRARLHDAAGRTSHWSEPIVEVVK